MEPSRPIAFPANPGASSAAVIYDNGPKNSAGVAGAVSPGAIHKGSHVEKRVVLAFYTNVADAVLRVEWAGYGTGLRLLQADVAIAANTFFQRSILIQPGRTKISIVTVTNPTTWEGAAELTPDQALAQ